MEGVRGEPHPEPFGGTDEIEVFGEPHPGRPADLRGVRLIEPVTTRDCPDEARETIDERGPRSPVSACGLPQKAAEVEVVHTPTVTTRTRRLQGSPSCRLAMPKCLGNSRDVTR